MKRRSSILLVEDDEVDADVMRLALAGAGTTRPVLLAGDGVEALAMLRGGEGRPPLARPLLLVVDLRMPRMDGMKLLAHVRADLSLSDLPAFVLTTSKAERHKRAAYALHVAGYLTKSDDVARMGEIAGLLERYCELVELP